jgi:hypothetical protein
MENQKPTKINYWKKDLSLATSLMSIKLKLERYIIFATTKDICRWIMAGWRWW